MILLFSVFFMVGALAFVWSNVKMIKFSYDYQALLHERNELLRKNQILKVERESLQSLNRIRVLAREELGLIEPANTDRVTIFLK